jgi:hypothetical protein
VSSTNVGGIALAGWNPLPDYGQERPQMPSTPTLDAIKEDLASDVVLMGKLNHCMDDIFRLSHPLLRLGGHLRPLVECVFATHLMSLAEFSADCGENNSCVQRLIGGGADHVIFKSELLEFGRRIKANFIQQNLRTPKSGPEIVGHLGTVLTTFQMTIERSFKTLFQHIGDLSTRLDGLEMEVRTVNGTLHDMRHNSQSSPNKGPRRNTALTFAATARDAEPAVDAGHIGLGRTSTAAPAAGTGDAGGGRGGPSPLQAALSGSSASSKATPSVAIPSGKGYTPQTR